MTIPHFKIRLDRSNSAFVAPRPFRTAFLILLPWFLLVSCARIHVSETLGRFCQRARLPPVDVIFVRDLPLLVEGTSGPFWYI